jgi:hypothetical protein
MGREMVTFVERLHAPTNPLKVFANDADCFGANWKLLPGVGAAKNGPEGFGF